MMRMTKYALNTLSTVSLITALGITDGNGSLWHATVALLIGVLALMASVYGQQVNNLRYREQVRNGKIKKALNQRQLV